MDLEIKHHCRQCGAPITLVETDRMVRCAFCRVKSYLLPQRYFRYVLPHRAPPGRELVYIPYWRYKGMVFYVTPNGVRHKFMDASRQAVPIPALPYSLGVRSQAMSLRFAVPETPGQFVQPLVPDRDVWTLFDRQIQAGAGDTCFHQTDIGESISLIYAPYYHDGRMVDAVLNRPVTESASTDVDWHSLDARRPYWRIRFVPTLCPRCGWDMDGERDTLVLNCPNCHSVWMPRSDRFHPISHAQVRGKNPGGVHLPFWRIRCRVEGVELSSRADLVRLANLPVAVRARWERTPFDFWSLAFKVKPRTFLRVARDMTVAQLPYTLSDALPEGRLHPVTLPLTEAAETLKIILSEIATPKRRILPLMENIRITPLQAQLVYVAFREGHHELIHDDLNMAINKQQLALAGNL